MELSDLNKTLKLNGNTIRPLEDKPEFSELYGNSDQAPHAPQGPHAPQEDDKYNPEFIINRGLNGDQYIFTKFKYNLPVEFFDNIVIKKSLDSFTHLPYQEYTQSDKQSKTKGAKNFYNDNNKVSGCASNGQSVQYNINKFLNYRWKRKDNFLFFYSYIYKRGLISNLAYRLKKDSKLTRFLLAVKIARKFNYLSSTKYKTDKLFFNSIKYLTGWHSLTINTLKLNINNLNLHKDKVLQNMLAFKLSKSIASARKAIDSFLALRLNKKLSRLIVGAVGVSEQARKVGDIKSVNKEVVHNQIVDSIKGPKGLVLHDQYIVNNLLLQKLILSKFRAT